ncbi:septum formation initiator family protein [Candidatus Microgenomates bacterium]|nr:septum formation initiator family protein [Candidatus Microgenomates bacterium]
MIKKLLPHANRRTLLMIIALAVIGYIGFATLQVISRNYKLQQDLDALQAEIELLKLKNQELEYQVAYFRTDAFADKEARAKLGLQAAGEKVVIFPDRIPKGVAVDEEAVVEPGLTAKEALSNFEEWLYFLFKKQPD